MAYNTSKGTRDLGDIQNENDKDTQIDFGSDQIAFKTNNIDRLTVTNAHVSCSVVLTASVFYGDGSKLQNVTGSGGTMSSFSLAGDAGSAQTIEQGNTLTIAGGTGMSSTVSATDTLTMNLDNTSVSAGSYTYSSLTVDAQGRLTAAANGAAPALTSITNTGNNRILTMDTSAGGLANAEASLTFDDRLRVTGSVNILAADSGRATAINSQGAISGTIGIHITGSDPHVAIGARRGAAPNSILLNVQPGEHDSNNKILGLFQQSEASGQRTCLGISGSAQVVVGGQHLAAVFNVSGSSAGSTAGQEILISAKSDTHNPAFQVQSDGATSVSGSLTVSGSLRAKQLHMTTHKYDADGSNAVFVRFDANGADTTASDNNKMVAPYSGQLIKVLVRGTTAGGSTVASMHRNVDGNQMLDASPIESITVNMANANTSYTFDFTAAADFGPGDICGIKINPSSDPGIVVATAVWEFDHNG